MKSDAFSRKSEIAIDEELLVAAQRILATKTVRETVEEAFREVVRAAARREEVRALAAMDGLDLTDPEVMAGAWRQ